MLRYSDFKCSKCLDNGRVAISCPDGVIGCLVYHTGYCDCETGLKLKEEFLQQYQPTKENK